MYVLEVPFAAVTRMLTVFSPSCRLLLPETTAVASGSEVTVSTETDLVNAGTVRVPSSETVEPLIFMLFRPVSDEGG